MTTFEEIIKRLEKLGIPVADTEFKDTKKHPAPEPPFTCYLCKETQRGSDQKNLIREIDGSVELYTDRIKDPSLEKRIETEVLFDIEFIKEQYNIKTENMILTSYDFELIQKKGF